MSSTTQAYAYVHASAVRETPAGRSLALETSGGATPDGEAANPRFFDGFLTAPAAAATALLAVADVAASRYYRPRPSAFLDPVVTAGGDRLRLESFSACCGVHARLDVLAPGLDGDDVGHGTTNVDINPPLRKALTRVRDGRLHLDVGPDDLTVTTGAGRVVERRVPLPDSWLRGFTEAQVITSGFDLRAEVDRAAAAAFLARLPRADTREVLWVVPAGRGLRLTARPASGGVGLGGARRLHLLTPFLRHARTLRVYGPAVGVAQSSACGAWELSAPGLRLTLTLSPQITRGFAAEGAALSQLAGETGEADADLVSALLAWDTAIDVGQLAASSGLPTDRVRAALTVLATAGRVGYDTAEAGYFHRALPQGRGVEQLNPRLRRARKLVADGAVTLTATGASVTGSSGVHTVRTEGPVTACTCTWWQEHRGDRGPCAHVLAVGLMTRTGAEKVLTHE